jgi:hypothetical protein
VSNFLAQNGNRVITATPVQTVEEMADTLDAVADDFDFDVIGWTRGSYENPLGFCAIGALRRSRRNVLEGQYPNCVPLDLLVHSRRQAGQIAYQLAAHLKRKKWANSYTTAVETVIGWNDGRDRTKEQVIEAFRSTAKELRERAAAPEATAT